MPNTDKYIKHFLDNLDTPIITTEQQQSFALMVIAIQFAGIRESLERIADSLENQK